MAERNPWAIALPILAVWWIMSAIAMTQNVQAQDAPTLRYDWKVGVPHGYQFDSEIQIENQKLTSKGYVTFQAKAFNVEEDFAGELFDSIIEGESTSTAFAVTADGYLLTCEHCIAGATEIKIVFGEREYDATVIDSDAQLDLAILKIPASGLPTVHLAKDRAVQLAQDVRAIGYPLSDVLGSSVKVARGSVAGFVRLDDAENIQVDVAVNFGNSGGPLLDDTGSVVGVVNAKLSGQRIAKVGFAVPIRFACEMLERNRIRFQNQPPTQLLSGVELAKRVTPAVLFVKTRIGKSANRSSNFQVTANGSFTSTGWSKTNELETVQGEAIVASNGDVVDHKNDSNLPLLLGSVVSLPFETLPDRPRKKWSSETGLILPLPKSMPTPERGNRLGMFGQGFPRGFAPPVVPGFGREFGQGFGLGFPGQFGVPREPRKQEAPMRIAAATRKTNYEVTKFDQNLVTISYQHELRSLGDDDEFSSLRIDEKGLLEFDRGQGLFTRKTATGTTRLRLGKENLSFDTRLNYQKTSLEKYLGTDVVASTPPQKPVDTAQHINAFVSGDVVDPSALVKTIDHLAACDVDPSKSVSVTRKLVGMLSERSSQVSRGDLLDALLNWNPTTAAPFVIDEYRKARAFSRRVWILRLGRTRDPRAAVVLAKLISEPRSRAVAIVAIENLGAVAESACLQKLKSVLDVQQRIAFLKLLGKIGGTETLAMIESLQGQDGWPHVEAKRTVQAIASRTN